MQTAPRCSLQTTKNTNTHKKEKKAISAANKQPCMHADVSLNMQIHTVEQHAWTCMFTRTRLLFIAPRGMRHPGVACNYLEERNIQYTKD